MHIRKPKITFATKIENFFECLFCEHKKDCPVRFGNRTTIFYSMPGELSSDFYHKNLCKKEDMLPYSFLAEMRKENILLILICSIAVLGSIIAVPAMITKNTNLRTFACIMYGIEIILIIIWFKISRI